MIQSNRSADEQSQFDLHGAMVGAAIGGLKYGVVDIPLHMLLNKDTSRMKDGGFKEFVERAQFGHRLSMANPMYRKLMSPGGRIATAAAMVGIGFVAGGFFGDE